ncbi:hypothetical protein CesoFtcFv8_005552 [Champsocephalus esox]|nr:hypothetical protein CesoFtcFv8_005552 [Champsocephalus esox]
MPQQGAGFAPRNRDPKRPNPKKIHPDTQDPPPTPDATNSPEQTNQPPFYRIAAPSPARARHQRDRPTSDPSTPRLGATTARPGRPPLTRLWTKTHTPKARGPEHRPGNPHVPQPSRKPGQHKHTNRSITPSPTSTPPHGHRKMSSIAHTKHIHQETTNEDKCSANDQKDANTDTVTSQGKMHPTQGNQAPPAQL